MKSPVTADRESEEAILVEAVQAGRVHAFEPLMERHLESIHAFISLKLPVPHLVDEITHETFVFAFHHIGQFTPGTSFRAWLRAIAGNKIRAEVERYWREERNRLAYSEQRALQAVLEKTSDEEPQSLEALKDCLNELPEKIRTLLIRKYHDEQSSEQIAQSLQRSIAWVRTTLCRVRQQLRECVERKVKLS